MLKLIQSFASEPLRCPTCVLRQPDPFVLTKPKSNEVCRSTLYSTPVSSPSERFYVFNRVYKTGNYCENDDEYESNPIYLGKLSPLPPILYSRHKRLETRWLYRSLFGELVFVDSSGERRINGQSADPYLKWPDDSEESSEERMTDEKSDSEGTSREQQK